MPQILNILVTKTSTSNAKILDASGNDITANGTLTVSSSDTAVVTVTPQTVQIGSNQVITGYAVKGVAAGTAQVTWAWSSPSGSISEIDTVNVNLAPPASIVVTYGPPQ